MLPLVPALAVVLVGLAACRPKAPAADDAAAPATSAASGNAGAGGANRGKPFGFVAAEASRSSSAIPTEAVHGDDLDRRRAAARAHARIQGDVALVPLRELLADDDDEVLAWAAYGLGFGCAGREETTVPVLAARLATRLRDEPPAAADAPFRGSDALFRALGSCGTKVAEGIIAVRLSHPDRHAEAAATALGVIASKRKHLEDESVAALLGIAENAADDEARGAALWALGRVDLGPFTDRAKKAAAAAVDHAGSTGLFALRLAAKTGALSEDAFLTIAADGEADASRRNEAVRGLLEAKPAEKPEATEKVAKNASSDPASRRAELVAVAKLVDALLPRLADPAQLARDYAVAARAIAALGTATSRPGPIAGAALDKVAKLAIPKDNPGAARRAIALRCAAAVPLAQGNADAPVVTACDPTGKDPAGRRAKSEILLARPLDGGRLAAYAALAKGASAAERERLLSALGTHAEAADLAAKWVTEGLAGEEPGVVATAATFVHEHREILAFARPSKEARDARDKAPAWLTALDAAVKRTWSPDLLETRIALLEALATARAEAANPVLEASACDPNVTVRTRVRALLGTRAPARPPGTAEGGEETARRNAAACDPAKWVVEPRDAVGDSGRVNLALRLDTGVSLQLHLDGRRAPLTVARIANLARDHFYDGIVVHRVVPGFVVQFGDKLGDGFGGSGLPLPCETSPLPFTRGSIGMALAGRDTGSSQLFVTLAPTPHLDGLYTLFGNADGPWDRVAEGDLISAMDVLP
jgi:cyclophilin family peptidyl-prolyl cis-trans isomerase